MSINELKLNDAPVDAVAASIAPQPEFVDRSDILFGYMNMIAFNNKIDLKITTHTTH